MGGRVEGEKGGRGERGKGRKGEGEKGVINRFGSIYKILYLLPLTFPNPPPPSILLPVLLVLREKRHNRTENECV